MATAAKIIKNTTYLTGAYIAQKLLSFVYFTMIARLAGVVDTGGYVFALSYTTIFTVFVDFGLSPLIQREVAKDPENTESFVQKALGVKLLYALVSVVIGLVIIHLLIDDPLTLRMVYIAMAVMVIDSFNLTVFAAFRGQHRLIWESVGVVIGQAIILVVGITGLVLKAPLEILIFALLAGSAFNAIYATILTRVKLGFWPKAVLRLKESGFLLKNSISFGLAGIFTRIFASIDSVLLRVMADSAAVGFYSIPNKVVFAAQFIPAAFAAAIYPAMSHHYQKDNEKMLKIFELSFLSLLVMSVPMAVGIFVLAPSIVENVFTAEYLPSIAAMQVLVWGIIFGFIEFPIGSLLAAIGQQGKNAISRGIVMVVNIAMNVVLIPSYSFFGSAIAALVSYALLVFLGLYWLSKFIRPDWERLIKSTLKVCLSALIMGLVVQLARGEINLIVNIFLGAGIYCLAILVLNVISFQEIKSILSSFRRGQEV